MTRRLLVRTKPRRVPAIVHLLLVLATALTVVSSGRPAVETVAARPDSVAAGPQTVRDDFGRPFTLPERTPARIVSMAPNITEILFALGLGPNIVGVTRFCDYPSETRTLPRIGGLVDPNIEIIQSLRPDLVIAFRGNPLRILDRLRDLRLPVFVLDIGNGLDALYPLIERLGRITRREKEASTLAAGLKARATAVDTALKGVTPRPRVFVFLYGQGLWTCGGESYINDLIVRAGAANIAATLPKKWALYSRERIVRDDPDAVFVLAKSQEDFEKARAWLAGEARLGSIAAVASGRVFRLDENAASRFGPRLVGILDAMARALHPERFGGRP
jgi:iron complex transport system substrate-binding protein